MCKSLLKELRFIIGEQYEQNEFNLKTVESTFINGLEYDSYEYIKGDFKALFGVEFSKNIILQYNADILSRVLYEFHKCHYSYLSLKVKDSTIKNTNIKLSMKDENSCQLVLEKK